MGAPRICKSVSILCPCVIVRFHVCTCMYMYEGTGGRAGYILIRELLTISCVNFPFSFNPDVFGGSEDEDEVGTCTVYNTVYT